MMAKPVTVAALIALLTSACSGGATPAADGVRVSGLDAVSASTRSCDEGLLGLSVANSSQDPVDAVVYLGEPDSSTDSEFTSWDVRIPPGEWNLLLKAGTLNNTTLSLQLDCIEPVISSVPSQWQPSFTVDQQAYDLAVLCRDVLQLVEDVETATNAPGQDLESLRTRVASLLDAQTGSAQADSLLGVLEGQLMWHIDQVEEGATEPNLAGIRSVNWLPAICPFEADLEAPSASMAWCEVKGKCDR